MKTRAAVAFEAKRPLEIVEVDLEGVVAALRADGDRGRDRAVVLGRRRGLVDDARLLAAEGNGCEQQEANQRGANRHGGLRNQRCSTYAS